jgi:uncharacterized membrane protein HdeD (DUF308 family)
MKNSTILIVAGIIIMIVGGIVFMNNIQDGSKNLPVSTNSATQKAHNLFADTVNSKPTNQPLNSSVMMVFIGAIAVVAGIYDSRRTVGG